MFQKLRTWLLTSFSYIWLIVLAVYFSILAGQAMYRNYQSQQQTRILEQQLSDAKTEKDRLEGLIVYYNSNEFKEKALRQSLLLKMPDEKVYALPESAVGQQVETAEAVRRQQADPRINVPTWRQWLDYLFGNSAAS